mmetsp:Transcript_3178/g.6875  ORF Transcript_3178/g.6875 Transcript_3178/m.6875 type:complete len:211 (+) Transcript_3178:381-1013(+)
MFLRCSIRTEASGYPYRTVSTSTVGSANPASVRSIPASLTSTNGPTWDETPPSRSSSARTREERSSGRVCPPGMAKRKQPSGLRTRWTSRNNPGKLFTQCIAAELITRSNVPSGNGSLSSSSETSRNVPHRSPPSTSTSSSRCRAARDESSWTNFRTPPIPPSPSKASSEHMARWTYPAPEPTSRARGNPPSRLMSSRRSTRRRATSSRK